MVKQLIALVAAAGLAASFMQHLSQRQSRRRSREERRRHHEDVNRWEHEGGNLPPGAG